MSIHDFHSKLMSGKEEGTLFEALRGLRKLARPALAAVAGEEPSNWSVWTDGSTSGAGEDATLGWTYWQDVTEAMSEA